MTHIKQQKFKFYHIVGQGYNTQFLLGYILSPWCDEILIFAVLYVSSMTLL